MENKSIKGFGVLFLFLISLISSAFATDVVINSNVDGVGIYENGTLIGTTVNNTATINFTDENHDISLVKEFYDTLNLTVNPLNETEVNATLEETEYLLALNSNVDGVTIFDVTNNESIGLFDNGFNVLLTHGDYELTVSKTGYASQTFNVSIPADIEINVTLVAEETTDGTTSDDTEDDTTADDSEDDEDGRTIIVLSALDDDSAVSKLQGLISDNPVVALVVFIVVIVTLGSLFGVWNIKGL
ncbi:PEGA domain-containing protein [Methanococcus sp. CF]